MLARLNCIVVDVQLLGRQAINFLEGTTEGFSPRHRMGASDELSFDHCFYIYGGRQSFEELEALGNECARLCNRLRTKLAPEGKARLDAAIASLGPLFDLQVGPSDDFLLLPADASGLQRLGLLPFGRENMHLQPLYRVNRGSHTLGSSCFPPGATVS